MPRRSQVALLGLLLTISVPSGATARTSSDDVAHYSSDNGVSYAEAARRLGLQEQIGELSARLAAESPSTFGGLWITHGQAFGVVAAFTIPPTGRASALLDDPALKGFVSTKTVAHSLEALEAVARAILNEAGPGTRPFDLDIDVQGNEVVIKSTPEDRQLVAALSGSTTDETDAVRYEDVDRLSQPAANIYGGLNIGCTSGFSVIGNGVKGVTTAAHCGPAHTYQGVTLPVKAEKYTTSYDIQWNSAPGFTVQPWAYDGDSTPRTIVGSVSRTNTPINAYLCKYGINTQFGCGYVISKSAAPSYIPGVAPTFMLLHNPGIDLASGSDSGGPVYSTTKAYGTISGWANGEQYSQAIYMASNYLTSGLGISLVLP